MVLRFLLGSIRGLGAAALVLALCAPINAIAAGVLFTRAASVKVLEKPTPKAAVIETIGPGVQLEGLQRKGLFWKVRTPAGASGFVMMTMVSEGSQQMGLKLQGAMRSLLKEKRGQDDGSEDARSRSKNAVMGIRGLNNGDLSQVGNLRPNYRALEQLEALEVDAQSVERLAREVLDEAARRTGS